APWHLRQFFAKIGSTSRANAIVPDTGGGSLPSAAKRLAEMSRPNKAGGHRRVIVESGHEEAGQGYVIRSCEEPTMSFMFRFATGRSRAPLRVAAKRLAARAAERGTA